MSTTTAPTFTRGQYVRDDEGALLIIQGREDEVTLTVRATDVATGETSLYRTGLLSHVERTTEAPDALFEKQMDDPDRYYANEARAKAAGLEPCTHCGRGVAAGSGVIITVVDGGSKVMRTADVTAADTAAPGYMGAWVLGSTCAKMIPAAFRAPFTGWEA